MNNLARKSGMRGHEPPAQEAAPDPEPAGATPEPEDTGIGQFVHGPDEQGHHHLNITKLHEHLQSKHAAK